MTLEQWQVALRRQFGREQDFGFKNVGGEPTFSDYEVTNPATGRTYRVAIRGTHLGDNFCSCPDFAVNTLGTCKHIEFALARLEAKRGGRTALVAGYHPPFSEVFLRYGAQREVRFRPGTECPPEIIELARDFFEKGGKLREKAFGRFHLFLKRAAHYEHDLRCYDDALAFIAQVRDASRLVELVDRQFPGGVRSAAFAKLLRTSMFPYQRAGALFAARTGRCILADDMGLGKTIQAIAASEILARVAGVERVLVVAPTSLKHQWKREIERFADRSALVVEGLAIRRRECYQAEAFYKITNYDVVHRDLDAIHAWEPDLVILDEAQRIKNWKTRAAQSIKRLRSQYAMVLTGTPLENRLEELHSIVEFVDRFRLGPMFRFLHEHQHVDECGRVIGYRNLKGIAQTLQPILLRRTKNEVLKELPERTEKRFFVAMTPQQQALHEENREIVARIVHKWRRYGYLSEADQRRLTAALTNMRMSCNSTYLLDQTTDFGLKADEMLQLLDELFETGERKVVVFSQWVRMHELLMRRFADRRWGHVLFHGGVPGPKRKDLVQKFREDDNCRLFLATDAGGVGLNLQHASALVNLDQPWNPAVLEQRIGRVHRLGQKRTVQVFHYIARGSIEEGMLSLLAFKKSVFAGVLDSGKDEVFLGETRLKQFMDSVDKVTGSIPQPVPEPVEPEPAAETAAAEAAAETAESVLALASPQEQAWTDLATAGMSFLDKLGAALASPPAAGATGGEPSFIARDPQTGEPYLRLPLPAADVVQKLLEGLQALVKR